MIEATNYRERVPVPGWTAPVLGALGAAWALRRIQRTLQKGYAWHTILSAASSVLTVVTLLRTVQRSELIAIEVDDDAVHLGAGVIERRIPATSIRDVRVVSYNPVRLARVASLVDLGRGRAFSQIGVRRGVEVTADEGGTQQRYFVSSNEPEALADAIAIVAGVESAT